MDIKKERNRQRSAAKDRLVAVVLLLCSGLALFWLIMSTLARRPWEPFDLSYEDFADFNPVIGGAKVQRVRIRPGPHEPNIVAFRCRDAGGDVFVRLVHGYNMVDCMRIKGFAAELLADTRFANDTTNRPAENLPSDMQAWRLTSPEGDVSIWVTSIIDAASFAKTPVDVRAMLFPRVGVPDAVGYAPRGITWDSLDDPIGEFRLFVRAEWNKSRSDLLTFLKLRQPAWASARMLTLVSRSGVISVSARTEESAVARVAEVHDRLHRALLDWHQRRN